MTLICPCGSHHEQSALEPFPRTCSRCGRCWRCRQTWPALCQCSALLLPWSLAEALKLKDAAKQDHECR